MRIHHATLPARDPDHVATVLAEILGARKVAAFHPEGSFFVTGDEPDGTLLEIWPAGTRAAVGEHHLTVTEQPLPEAWPHHCYVSCETDAETILGVFEREGWKADQVHNGPPQAGFDLIRGWIENHAVIEVVTPDMRTQYEKFIAMALAPR